MSTEQEEFIEAQFIDHDEVAEEETLDEWDDARPMEEEEEEDGEEGNTTSTQDDSVQAFFSHKEPVYSVSMHPADENLIATGGGDDRSFLWRADTGEQVSLLGGHTDSVISVVFSTDGQYVASGSMDGRVRVWKVETREFVTSLEGPDEVVWLNWHPKGSILLAGATDSTIWMWQLPSGKCMNVFSGHSAAVNYGQFTPDGKKIITCSDDTSLIVWDPKTAASTLKITGDDVRWHSSSITSMAVNQDSAILITGSSDNTSRLVNISSGNILGTFGNHTDAVETVGFSTVLPVAATGSLDNKIHVWDMNTLRLRQTMQHDDAIIKLQWHADTPLLTSCSSDRTVRTWDTRTGGCERVWSGHQDTVLDFALSRDGKTIVTGGDDGVSLVFRA